MTDDTVFSLAETVHGNLYMAEMEGRIVDFSVPTPAGLTPGQFVEGHFPKAVIDRWQAAFREFGEAQQAMVALLPKPEEGEGMIESGEALGIPMIGHVVPEASE